MQVSTNRRSKCGLRAAFTLLLALGVTQIAHARVVYKCNDAKGMWRTRTTYAQASKRKR